MLFQRSFQFSPRKGQNEPNSVNIDKITTALHVHYLNLIVNEPNTVQIAQMQIRAHYMALVAQTP